MPLEHTSAQRKIPPFIERSINRWRSQSAFLQYLYMFLAVVAIVAPLGVATFTDILGSGWTRALSFVGAGAAALTTGFRLQQKGNDMRKAYFELQSLAMSYKAGDTISEIQLIDEFKKIAFSVAILAGPEGKPSPQPPSEAK